MCFPPICHPATHVLGCFGLRQGAGGVLVLNALYGLCLVIVHALLLGEIDKEQGAQGAADRHVVNPGMQPRQGLPQLPPPVKNEGVGWLIQLLDLDIGWGHRLLGFDDQSDLIAGLVYGIIIICICAYTFQQINAPRVGGECVNLPTVSRWFVAFMNLELLLYLGLVAIKLPLLCKLQAEFMPNLGMECEVQRFMFLQRVLFLTVAASMCIWVFSSYAFSLTFGNVTMDQPEFAEQLDIRDAALTGKMDYGPPGMASMNGNGLGPGGPPRRPASIAPAYQTRHSLSPPTGAPQRNLMGAPPAASFQSGRGGGGGSRTSYHIGSMARAGSSMVSSGSGDPEMQALIKPPLHVF
ncbi:unnamed protein product [Symbiodinium natans]|uniref:Transmembrane protein n=1 Tax=Symbiodinium natans TaxID=878477 RepID=A0A812N7H0_9DINO|nr:unnamed protein product [Symbiodinium natans]